jgi:hypothetical protein
MTWQQYRNAVVQGARAAATCMVLLVFLCTTVVTPAIAHVCSQSMQTPTGTECCCEQAEPSATSATEHCTDEAAAADASGDCCSSSLRFQQANATVEYNKPVSTSLPQMFDIPETLFSGMWWDCKRAEVDAKLLVSLPRSHQSLGMVLRI